MKKESYSVRVCPNKGTPLSTLRTDENGTFEINSLPAGKYDLQVTGEGIKGLIKELDVNENKTVELKVQTIETAFTKDWGTANGNINRNAVSANAMICKLLKTAGNIVLLEKGVSCSPLQQLRKIESFW